MRATDCFKYEIAPETQRPWVVAVGVAIATWGIVEFPVLGGSDILLPSAAILAGATLAAFELRPREAEEAA
jgi:hypothetical protein